MSPFSTARSVQHFWAPITNALNTPFRSALMAPRCREIIVLSAQAYVIFRRFNSIQFQPPALPPTKLVPAPLEPPPLPPLETPLSPFLPFPLLHSTSPPPPPFLLFRSIRAPLKDIVTGKIIDDYPQCDSHREQDVDAHCRATGLFEGVVVQFPSPPTL